MNLELESEIKTKVSVGDIVVVVAATAVDDVFDVVVLYCCN